MNNKKDFFSTVFCIFIAVLFLFGCNNHLLKLQQEEAHLIVKIANSTGARNASTTGDWQISAWIENQDGSESHHQNLNSASGEETSLTFDDLVIGSQINIHLELTKNDDTQTKLTGESDWTTVKAGEQVIEIEWKSMTNTDDSGGGNGEGGSNSDDGTGDDGEDPASGNPGEGDEELVLTSFDVQYDPNQYQLVNTNINLSNITITQHFDNGSTKEVKASEVRNDYTIEFADGVDKSNAIGNVPAYVEYKHDSTIGKQPFIIPIKYQLDASNLSISGDTSVEQNKELKLTAKYEIDGKDSYNLYTSASSSSSYKIIEKVNISWQGATKQQNAWEAMAETSNAGTGKTATVTLTPNDEWCVTTGGVEKSHSYEVTEPAPSYDPTVGLSWDSSTSYLTIYNEQGLKNFRDIVNGSLTQAITVDGKTFSGTDRTVSATLANNITLTGEWTPIGKSGAPYAGTFDGADHTVSGISITSGTDKGFFGYIQSQATIANLIVEGNISGYNYVGGIVAHSKGGNINYCINKINVTNTSTGQTGGIVGYIYIGTTITGCVNFGTITGYNYTGGIVGQNRNDAGGTTIDRCINFGTITSTSSSAYIGGIYGYSLSTSDKITNSANFGSIVSSYYGAGIVNYDASDDTTLYCLNVGDMTGVTTPIKNYPIANTDSSDLPNYYDSSKIGNTSVPSKGGTGKATTDLKVDSPWDTSWTTTNWSFATGRYPVPNIRDNIPSEIWNEIVEAAK